MLSWMLMEGEVMTADPVEAREWALKAAEGGIAAAMTRLGMIYHNALGVPRDPSQAVYWWRNASAAGDPDGEAMLALRCILAWVWNAILRRHTNICCALRRAAARLPPLSSRQRVCAERKAMIVGTAGHIDHGKTSLVRALTQVDTDRLKEERHEAFPSISALPICPCPATKRTYSALLMCRGMKNSYIRCLPARRALISSCWLSLPMTGSCRKRANIWQSSTCSVSAWHRRHHQIRSCRT